MPKGSLLGDIGSDHDGFPPTPITAGSPTVKIDGKPVVRKGDLLSPHDSVNIDGLPAARVDDAVSCGGVSIGGFG